MVTQRFFILGRRHVQAVLALVGLAIGPGACEIEGGQGGVDTSSGSTSATSSDAATSASDSPSATTTANSSSDDATTSGMCADFVANGDPMAKCQGKVFRARCEHAATFREQVFDWGFNLVQFEKLENGDVVTLSPAELERRQACMVAALEAAGASQINAPPDARWFVRATASYGKIADSIAIDPIRTIEARCRPDISPEACPCGELDQSGCSDHPFCFAVSGRKVEPDQHCLGPTQVIGCTSASGCGPRVTAAYAPGNEEALWIFPSSCLPDQAGWTPCIEENAGNDACDGADWPACSSN